MNTEYIAVIIGGAFLLTGAFFLITEVIGIYRFGHSLKRMHAAALGDTGGLMFIIIGLIILNGLQASSFKLGAIWAFMWTTSPVSSHMLSKLIYYTDADLSDCDDTAGEVK